MIRARKATVDKGLLPRKVLTIPCPNEIGDVNAYEVITGPMPLEDVVFHRNTEML